MCWEEFVFDWQNWARNVLHLSAQWGDFYITNVVVIVLGTAAAEIAPALPAVALGFPALMLINATFFHVAPVIWTRGRFSPGVITAVLLFFPLGLATDPDGPYKWDYTRDGLRYWCFTDGDANCLSEAER